MIRLLTSLTSAALLAAAQPAWGAQPQPPLGRLFFTPKERAALDHARRNKIAAEQQAVVARTSAKPKAPPPRLVVVNGYVKRSDGESTVWLNSQPVRDKTEEGLQVRPTTAGDGSVLLRAPQTRRSVSLKVGQQMDLTTGRIEELYRLPPPEPEAQAPQSDKPAAQSAKPAPRARRADRRADSSAAAGAGAPPAAEAGASEKSTE